MTSVTPVLADAVSQSSTCPAAARYLSERITEDVGYLASLKWTAPELVRHYREFFGHWPKKGTPEFGDTLESVWADLDRRERQDRAVYERTTVVARLGGKDATIADLRRAFDSVQNPGDWKAPVDAVIGSEDADLVREAVRFFQGDDPLFFGLDSFWRRLPASLLRVTSRGYQG